MVAAIDAKLLPVERRIHEMTMIGAPFASMDEGVEISTGDAHPLNRNGVLLLKMADHLDEGHQ